MNTGLTEEEMRRALFGDFESPCASNQLQRGRPRPGYRDPATGNGREEKESLKRFYAHAKSHAAGGK